MSPSSLRPVRFASLVSAFFFASLIVAGCGDDDGGGGNTQDGAVPDGGVDTSCPADAPMPNLAWTLARVGTTAGIARSASIGISRDFCDVVELTFTSSNPAVVAAPATTPIVRGQSQITVELTGVAPGTSTITATWMRSGMMRTAMLEVAVTDTTVPACAGTASGMLSPGGRVEVAAGTSLAGAAIALPAGAARTDDYHVAPFSASIACAPDQLPAGYRALGPAVTFSPVATRMPREITVTLPMRLSLLPAGANRGHVEVAYTGPGVSTARVVPFASPAFSGSAGDGLMTFQTSRLGTFQAVVRSDAPTRRMRDFKFNGILGFSMGSGGAAGIGLHNPDKFDFIAPLGGVVDWIYFLHYIQTYHVGGFCSAEERAMNPSACGSASSTRVPPPDQLYEHIQDFEHWWYEDGYGGQGGTFDRETYFTAFRDFSMMFGNPNTDRVTSLNEPDITPPGVPDSERMRPDAERCAHPVVIPNGVYDDEYNPDGSLPVITFCDGGEVRDAMGRRDVGVWDPRGDNVFPSEVIMAVDVNRNGVRDPGEPVIRNGHEPFDDFGLDNVPSERETGYDPVSNPDPAGDDYDFQFNPNGTEGNWLRDGDPAADGTPGVAEAYLDAGLDGVIGTAQLRDGGYDNGEGNHRYDLTLGGARMLDRNPRSVALRMPVEQLRDIDVFSDGGVRDLFNFAVLQDHFIGAFGARGLPVHLFNGHASLQFNGLNDDEMFVFTQTPWHEVGKYAMTRYGDVDASDARRVLGDGGHVGTPEQLVNRLLSSLAWMSARWPDGDRRRFTDQICTVAGPGCPQPNSIQIDFTAPSTGRLGPAAIILPPGYNHPENATRRYPVIYFLHGYGMEPQDLVALGVIVWSYMNSPTLPEAQRLQKMIFVFPDGRCRGDECVRGTFYNDAPPGTPHGAQMERWMLDLKDYVDAHFRTRSNESFPVVE